MFMMIYFYLVQCNIRDFETQRGSRHMKIRPDQHHSGAPKEGIFAAVTSLERVA
ncbi:hypothetical protein LHGZ1_2919 [Laribacter hongkongensis]|uniref:Uncharacterized protein n=1 Tax=Laribacter hongkongensis TaxID=168471 RepID=A0A248LLS8_9NEIS|nr:hypothetical protein LHGZ1_2919 [Laribacter hongkongensis]